MYAINIYIFFKISNFLLRKLKIFNKSFRKKKKKFSYGKKIFSDKNEKLRINTDTVMKRHPEGA